MSTDPDDGDVGHADAARVDPADAVRVDRDVGARVDRGGPEVAGPVDAVVVVAMPDEAEPFLTRASTVGHERRVGGATLRRLRLEGREVLLVLSGIGLVNAASATTAALLDGGATGPGGDLPAVVSAGSAGGLGVEVRVGDVVVGTRHTYTDADARAFGYVQGQVPGMPEAYDGSPELVRAAASADVGLRVRTGLMLSGDSFVDANLVDQVRAGFDGALSTDMESTAVAQVAHRYGAPFVSVRGVSDLCGPAAEDDFLTHVDDAADRSAAIVSVMLTGLRPRA